MYLQAKSLTSFDNTKIYYEISHSHITHKNTLIFLHGLGGDLSDWNDEKNYFNKLGYKTIVLDLRGHGLSERKDNIEAYDFDSFVEDIVALIKKEKIKKPVIIGHCFGGMITMILAGKYPDIAEALILVDTGYKSPDLSKLVADTYPLRTLFMMIMKVAPQYHFKGHADNKGFLHSEDYDWKRILSDVSHVSLKSYMMISKNLWNYNISKTLKSIKAPTLVIEGLRDSIFPPAVARQIHKRIIKSDILLIKNANHILVTNDPKDLNSAIYNYLSKLKI
jgi:pimeloyl-ACP methyl ester carboxylesterase